MCVYDSDILLKTFSDNFESEMYIMPENDTVRKVRRSLGKVTPPAGFVWLLIGLLIAFLCYAFLQINSLSEQLRLVKNEADAVRSDISTMQYEKGKLTTGGIYDKALGEVVTILIEPADPEHYVSDTHSGAGFFIADGGYVATNLHVIGDTIVSDERIRIGMFGQDEPVNAKMVGYNNEYDLAILKIDGGPAVNLSVSDRELHVGDPVYAVGHPLGNLEYSFSCGCVGSIDRKIALKGNKPVDLLQLDISANVGNSGGPVYDRDGNIVGMITAKYSGNLEGLVFAIPTQAILDCAETIMAEAEG